MNEEDFDEYFKSFDFGKIAKIAKLVSKAKKVIKKNNKTYYFNCPNCGNEVYGGRASNGHLHVKCEHCNIAM